MVAILGLAVVKHIVERHDGTIRVESQGPGRGACFSVELQLELGAQALEGLRPRRDDRELDGIRRPS